MNQNMWMSKFEEEQKNNKKLQFEIIDLRQAIESGSNDSQKSSLKAKELEEFSFQINMI